MTNAVNGKGRPEIFISHLLDIPQGATDAKSLVIGDTKEHVRVYPLCGIAGGACMQVGSELFHFHSGDELLWDPDEGEWEKYLKPCADLNVKHVQGQKWKENMALYMYCGIPFTLRKKKTPTEFQASEWRLNCKD